MCPLKIKFVGILTWIFKDEESGKMSAGGACALKLCEGELINTPVLGSPSLFKYWCWVCIYSFKYNYYFEYYAVDGYLFYLHISLKSSFLYL